MRLLNDRRNPSIKLIVNKCLQNSLIWSLRQNYIYIYIHVLKLDV